MGKAQEPQLMVQLFPELSAELDELLTRAGEQTLASWVSKLDRCRCGDDFAAHSVRNPNRQDNMGPVPAVWHRSPIPVTSF